MRDLRIYDFDFNLLHIENKIVSSSWERHFCGAGKAEVHLPCAASSVPLLFENKYLLMTQGDLQAIVTAKQIGSECVIYGRTPEWILGKRTVLPFETISGRCEEIVRNFVGDGFGDVDNFVLADALGLSEETEKELTVSCALSQLIEECLSACGLGYRVALDIKNKRWVFSVCKSEARSLIISESNKNAYDTEYISDLQDYFSSGIYFFENEFSETVHQEITKDEKDGIYKWTAPLAAENADEAAKELGRLSASENITSYIKELHCGRDYDVGDIIKLQFEKSKLRRTMDMKITGVTFWYESGKNGEMPKFEEVNYGLQS